MHEEKRYQLFELLCIYFRKTIEIILIKLMALYKYTLCWFFLDMSYEARDPWFTFCKLRTYFDGCLHLKLNGAEKSCVSMTRPDITVSMWL